MSCGKRQGKELLCVNMLFSKLARLVLLGGSTQDKDAFCYGGGSGS
jgi:hypothetical protein